MRNGVRMPALLVAVLLAVCNMTPGWSVRPQVFTYLFFTFLLVVLDRVFTAPGRGRLLWILPPLFALWANTHGGFVAGLGVLWLYVGVHGLLGLARRGWSESPQVFNQCAAAVLAALATLVNPYGMRLLTWLVE